VAAEYTFHEPPATFAYYSYWRGLDVTQVHAWLETGLFLGLIPTDDDLTLVFYQAPAARFEDARRDPVEAYLRTLHSRPQIRELLQRGALAERLRGSRDLPTFFRRSAGPGWALAGDAGHHKDPLIARGIADAFRDADLLARHLLDGWDADLDSALRRYERDRNGVAAPLAAANSALARLDSTSSSLALRWQQAAALEARLDAVQPGGAESSTPVPSGTVS
jgi:flavin-dependent dehydrogenase